MSASCAFVLIEILTVDCRTNMVCCLACCMALSKSNAMRNER